MRTTVSVFVGVICTMLPGYQAAPSDQVNQSAGRRAAEEREQQRRATIEGLLREGVARTDASPRVENVHAGAGDLIAVTIADGRLVPAYQEPYLPLEGDDIRVEGGSTWIAWRDGRPAEISGERALYRADRPGAPSVKVGLLVARDTVVAVEPRREGDRLMLEAVAAPRAYMVRSDHDERFVGGLHPLAVHRKSVPVGHSPQGPAIRHRIYLRLPHSMRDGVEYMIELRGVNTREAAVSYRHDPVRSRTESIHVNHVGFRPDDPLKRAYLSLWAGDGGGIDLDAFETFELLDAETRAVVYRGRIAPPFSVDRAESLTGQRNHVRAPVRPIDFSGFTQPGQYVVHVPGLGVSWDFPIGDDTWSDAFRVGMHGLLAHRSGIALGPPFTEYVRPRPMHPDDGFTILQAAVTSLDGESEAIRRSLSPLVRSGFGPDTPPRVPEAWGGYMDAGDWDRRTPHLEIPLLLIELYEMSPQAFAQMRLHLPPEEANNALPDILDEALWAVDFFTRMQLPDGGVRGGVESTEHPRPGETSWQESLVVGAFAADARTSELYAAAAASAARVLAPFDANRSADLARRARRAWDWADTNAHAFAGRGGSYRAHAAIEMYRLTGDAVFRKAFVSSSALWTGGDPGRELGALFAAARLPNHPDHEEVRRRAREYLLREADRALEVATGNAFGIAHRVPIPMMGWLGFYSVPESAIGPLLPRAHALTGDRKYLVGLLSATLYGVGANPTGRTMTTGLGHDMPRHVLHVDTMRTGQAAPAGITVYGPHDPGRAPDWVRQWYLSPAMHPSPDLWPPAEFHVDITVWPEMNEYTVHQCIVRSAYAWGYLATRP